MAGFVLQEITTPPPPPPTPPSSTTTKYQSLSKFCKTTKDDDDEDDEEKLRTSFNDIEELKEIVQIGSGTETPLLGSQIGKDIILSKSNGSLRSFKKKYTDLFPRTVEKDGSFNCNVKKIGIARHHLFLEDIFTTLVEIRWRLLLFIFCLVYFGSWLAFAVIWYALLYFHGDFEDGNLGNSKWTPCIADLKDFTAAFLFSVETQHTTGYGFYHLTEECSGTIITFCLQSIVGCILEGVMVGLLFVKIARGKKRTATLLFSKNAVISQNNENGTSSFMFRVADLRNKSNLLEARIRAQLLTRQSVETCKGDLKIGEFVLKREELKVSADGYDGTDFLLFWPTTIVHEITPTSPLYKIFNPAAQNLKKDDWIKDDFEIIVVLEGIVESTGQMTQARSSYVSSEVFCDHSFQPLIMTSTKKSSNTSEYEIDYTNFNEIIPNSPLPSQEILKLEEIF